MSPLELQSTTFIPSLEKTRPNMTHLSPIMCPDLSTWPDLDTFSPRFSNSSGNVSDLFQDSFTLNYSPSYSSAVTGTPNFIDEPLLFNQFNGYNSYPLCNYDQNGENNFGVGYCYQMCDKSNVGNVFSTCPISDSSNIYDPIAQSEIWGCQSRHTIPNNFGTENSGINNKVGRYSLEQRKERILRYLHKKHLRNFRKTIKYACRKTLADRRVRVRGRFAKNQDEDMCSNQNELIYFDYTKNLEYCDQEWVQEAMEALM